jgi:hypothetical protein
MMRSGVSVSAHTTLIDEAQRPAADKLANLYAELQQCRQERCSRSHKQQLSRGLAALHAKLLEPEAALAHIKEAADMYDGSEDDGMIAEDAIAIAMHAISSGRYEEARNQAQAALTLELSITMAQRLHFVLSAAHECQGRFGDAVISVERAIWHQRQPRRAIKRATTKTAGYEEGFGHEYSVLRRYYEILRTYELYEGYATAPDSLERRMRTTQADVLGLLTTAANTSGWKQREWALPYSCELKVTPSQPWYTTAEVEARHGLGVRVLDLLRMQRAPLAAEYDTLKTAGKMHAAGGWATSCLSYDWRSRKQTWQQYTANAPHLPLLPHSSCAADAPVACGLLRALRTDHGLRVLWVAYSAVEAGGLIRSHHGVACGQLKVHLGLKVPTSRKVKGRRQRRCVTLRVANETHGWAEGEVTLFDDAYEHEVRNACSSERVVLEIVLVVE